MNGFTPREAPPSPRAAPAAAVELDCATQARLRHRDALLEVLAVATELSDRVLLADLACDRARPVLLNTLYAAPCYDVSALPPLPAKDATTKERSAFALAVLEVVAPQNSRLAGIVRFLRKDAGIPHEYGT